MFSITVSKYSSLEDILDHSDLDLINILVDQREQQKQLYVKLKQVDFQVSMIQNGQLVSPGTKHDLNLDKGRTLLSSRTDDLQIVISDQPLANQFERKAFIINFEPDEQDFFDSEGTGKTNFPPASDSSQSMIDFDDPVVDQTSPTILTDQPVSPADMNFQEFQQLLTNLYQPPVSETGGKSIPLPIEQSSTGQFVFPVLSDKTTIQTTNQKQHEKQMVQLLELFQNQPDLTDWAQQQLLADCLG